MKTNTFNNLSVLKATQEEVMILLGPKYHKTIEPFRIIVEMTMKSNNIDVFTAMMKIKDELALYNEKNNQVLFASAVVEIVEEKHFEEFRK